MIDGLITIDAMIKCVEREIAMRERVYPRWVESKKMSQEKADDEIQIMKAVLDRLKQDRYSKADLAEKALNQIKELEK